MTPIDLLHDAFGRIEDGVKAVLDGIDPESLLARPGESANHVCWLIWHLTRVQDDHIAEVAGREQLWTAGGWADRFDLSLDVTDIGYGAEPADVAAVDASAELLSGYFAAVHEATIDYLSKLSDEDLDRVVDDNWDPPVTLGARLVSVISDDLQHIGQAAYVKGLLG